LADGSRGLVLCRNPVIYLQVQRSDVMFRGIVDRMSPGGFLVVGKAERPPAGLRLAAVGRCVYRKSRDE
jgi:chemotaxis protein methyltransferase CheR/two-component system CheB/CheR fusion protein